MAVVQGQCWPCSVMPAPTNSTPALIFPKDDRGCEQAGGRWTGIFAGDCENLPFADSSFDTVLRTMSFHHYPNPERFFQSVYRILRKGGRLILRDMTSSSRLMMWLINHIELPIIRTVFHKGDVHCYNRAEIAALCQQSGLVMERFEIRKGFRMHCVCRKQERTHEGGILCDMD